VPKRARSSGYSRTNPAKWPDSGELAAILRMGRSPNSFCTISRGSNELPTADSSGVLLQEDRGVVLPALGSPFVLEFSDEAWREVEDKLLPFAEDSGGDFTWLTNEGDVNVLISESGQW